MELLKFNFADRPVRRGFLEQILSEKRRHAETRGDTGREKIFFIFLSPRRVSPFLAWGDFHAPSRFARSTIPEEKWGLLVVYIIPEKPPKEIIKIIRGKVYIRT